MIKQAKMKKQLSKPEKIMSFRLEQTDGCLKRLFSPVATYLK